MGRIRVCAESGSTNTRKERKGVSDTHPVWISRKGEQGKSDDEGGKSVNEMSDNGVNSGLIKK